MEFNGYTLDEAADEIRSIRDFYFDKVPVKIMFYLIRILKRLEQEYRYYNETDNFLRKTIGVESNEYEVYKKELFSTTTIVSLKLIPFDVVRESSIPIDIIETIMKYTEKE